MKRAILTSTAAILALIAAPAFAEQSGEMKTQDMTKPAMTQDSTRQGSKSEAGSMGDTAAAGTGTMAEGTDIAPELASMTVGEVIGTPVENSEQDSIGEIDYVISGASGPEAVIGVGGFLGLGEHTVAVALSDFTYDTEDEQLVLASATKDRLEQLPEVDESAIESVEDDVLISALVDGSHGTDSAMHGTPETEGTDVMN